MNGRPRDRSASSVDPGRSPTSTVGPSKAGTTHASIHFLNAGKRQVERTIVRRIEEIATEAAMLGVTRQEFSRIVERAAAGKLKGATS